MQPRSLLLTLAAFTLAASAEVVSFSGIASLYDSLTDPAPLACGTPVSDASRSILLSPAVFNASQCGKIVAILNRVNGFGGEVTIGDLCTTCEDNDFKLTELGFNGFLNETEKADGVDSFRADYVLGLFD